MPPAQRVDKFGFGEADAPPLRFGRRDGSQPSASSKRPVRRDPLIAPPHRAERGAECDVQA